MFGPLKFFRSLSLVHWLVVALSLILTLSAWQISSGIADERAKLKFGHEVRQLNGLLRDRMRVYEFALISGTGAIKASGGEVNNAIWQRFSESLALEERLPGINGIGVIERVAPDQLETYLADKKQERPYFRIHPAHERQDFWPIVYIEPEESNRAAVGLDMAHERNRYQAATKAMETGETQITGPIVLAQDARKTPGFLFFRPFYETADTPPPDQREESFRGLVYAPFIMSKLMDGTRASANRMVHLRITDGASQLYSELDQPSDANYDSTPMFRTSYSLDMYGREWHFEVQTSELFETYHSSVQPLFILIGGIIINTLVLVMFAMTARAHRRARRQVREKTTELRESLDFINTLTDNLPLAVSVWDSDLTCRFMNAYGEQWFPISKQDSVGQPLEHFLGKKAVEERRDYYERVLNGEPVHAKTTFPDRNGDVRDIMISYHPVTLDGERCFMATTLDVTEVVGREKELRALNEELEKQKQKAESAANVKTAFLANMSHEIRTPMNAIIGVLVMLKDSGLGNRPRRLVNKAYAAAEALLLLLNDILDLSKIEADRVDLYLQPFEIEALIHRSVDVFAIVAEEKGLRLRVAIDPETPDRIVGDLLRITQVCTNLIGNAVKFTRRGHVEVRIGFRQEGEAKGMLSVEVEDTGIGIPDSEKERVFDNFRQATDANSRQFGGTGLGLSISRRLVELMGGRLSLESVVNEGSVFRFTVPVQVAADAKTMGTAQTDKDICVLHHGFGHNLALLEDYKGHWGLQLEHVTDLSQWREIMARVTEAGESADIFFVVDMERVHTDELQDMVDELLSNPANYPIWSMLVVVPAGYADDWIIEFQRHGGRVAYEPLTPSRFYEHLAQRHWHQADTTGVLRPRFPGIAVLIVDDVPLNCEIVETYLKSFGVESQAVMTGDEAISLLKQRAFDLVLMDLHLDGETGQEVALRIAETETVNKPIIAALSASIADKDRLTAKEAGMEDYLTKPVVPSDIQLLLETYFKREGSSEAGNAVSSVETTLPDCISPLAYERLFGDDPALFLRCVKSFIAGSADMVIEAHGCNTLQASWRLAHKVKGVAANIGDTQLEEQARLLETSTNDDAARGNLLALVRMVESHAKQLEAFVPEDSDQSETILAPAALRAALDRVSDRFNRNRIADDDDIEAIIGFLLAQGRTKLASQLRQFVEAYEFEKALSVVGTISVGDREG